jgi:hypothetical protein
MIGKGKPVGFGFEEALDSSAATAKLFCQGAQSKTRKTLLLLLQIIMLLAICWTRPCLLFGETLPQCCTHETRQPSGSEFRRRLGPEASDGLNQ